MSVTVGDEHLFAVRWEVEHTPSNWVLGRLEFIIKDKRVGDWEDTAALNAAFGWMNDFFQYPVEQDGPELMDADKEVVVALLHDRYMICKMTDNDLGKDELYSSSHHLISYLGMSSFDKWVLILIEGSDSQRVVWASWDDRIIHEAFLPARTIQAVLARACECFYAGQA